MCGEPGLLLTSLSWNSVPQMDCRCLLNGLSPSHKNEYLTSSPLYNIEHCRPAISSGAKQMGMYNICSSSESTKGDKFKSDNINGGNSVMVSVLAQHWGSWLFPFLVLAEDHFANRLVTMFCRYKA